MNEQEILIKIEKIKKIRNITRIIIMSVLILGVICYYMGIDEKVLMIGFIVICIGIIVGVGFPTQKKLTMYEKKLKELSQDLTY